MLIRFSVKILYLIPLHRLTHQFRRVEGIKLFQQAPPVALNGVKADLEDHGYFAGGKPLADQFQDALFLSGDWLHSGFFSSKIC